MKFGIVVAIFSELVRIYFNQNPRDSIFQKPSVQN